MQSRLFLHGWFFVFPLLLAVESANAEEISFKVTGTVSFVSGFAPNGTPLVEPGDTISLCYTFESEAEQDPDGSNANLAFYPDALRDVTLEAGLLQMSGSTGSINVANDLNQAGDTYQVFATGLSGSGLPTLASNVFLEDRFRQTVFSSTDLPLAATPDLSKFDRKQWFFGDRDNRLSATVDAIEFCGAPDTDGDGIPDDEDACPESDLSPTIVIDGIDTDVENQLFDNGCTMADLILFCVDISANHGDFVSCVAHLTNDWKKESLISGKEKGKIQKAAAKAYR